jgi:AcrR family transcriptional regulator/DNA-binding MarR family transcriptional regulator
MSARRSAQVRTPTAAPAGASIAGVGARRGGGEGLPREHVSEIQRLRILSAMGEVAAERGAGAVTVAHVVARAGVSRRTFYDLFEDREACFLAAFQEALGRVAGMVLPAYRGSGSWRERTRAALWALLVFFDAHPAAARLCVVEALAAGPRALERRQEVVRLLIAAVDEGRAEVPKGSRQPPPLAADGVVGAVLSVIHARLLQPMHKPLAGLLGELMGMVALPYLGPAGARREIERPTPPSLPTQIESASDPLGELDMRITYRTVRVLMTIAANPGASNREVAAQAGISDQGQVSKLLGRLEHLGLARNTGIGAVKGAPNAWRLTSRGEQVERAIHVHIAPR